MELWETSAKFGSHREVQKSLGARRAVRYALAITSTRNLYFFTLLDNEPWRTGEAGRGFQDCGGLHTAVDNIKLLCRFWKSEALGVQ
jgi:hypothetical protein